MSDEIRVSAGLNCTQSSGAKMSKRGHTTADQTGDAMCHNVQAVGTSEETLAKGDIATIGLVWIKNWDETNFVEVGIATGVYQIKLGPLDTAVFRTNGATDVYVKADTAECSVESLLLEV